MRHMEQGADGTAHAVHDGDGSVVEGDARFQGRQGHFLSGLHISALVEGNGQILEDPLHRGKGEYIRKRLCLHGGEGLHRVGQSVKAGGRRGLRRRGDRELRIHDRQVRHQHVPSQQHLHILFGIRDDGEAGRLGTGSRRGGNGRRGRKVPFDLLSEEIRDLLIRHGQRGNRLHGVDGASAAQGDQKIAAVLFVNLQALVYHHIRRFSGHAVEHAVGNPVFLQDRRYLIQGPQLSHHLIRNDQSAASHLLKLLSRLIQRAAAADDLAGHDKSVCHFSLRSEALLAP